MGDMCAHKLTILSHYLVMTCSKSFDDGAIRKVRVVHIATGRVIGEASTPQVAGLLVNPETDSVAVVKTSDGIAVAYMQLGVGTLIEVVEYYNHIGFRVQVNTFSSCSANGTVLSDGEKLWV